MVAARRLWRIASIAAALGTLTAACTPEIGGQVGSALGTVGGSYITRSGIAGSSQLSGLATVVGTLIGSEIAKHLNKQERAQAEQAARESLGSETVGSGSTRTWTSTTNPEVSGGSTIVAERKGVDGKTCRNQRNFVNVKGKDVEQNETLCRDPSTGAWTAVA